MAGTYAFIGHDFIGAYLERRLGERGWCRVEDTATADVVFTYCVSSSLLEDAYFDKEGLVKHAAAGALLVDLSPSTPSFAREISAVATVNDLVFVEAPLVVKDPFGLPEFTCFAACEEPDGIDEARGLLEAIATDVHIEDGVGNAQLAKAKSAVRAVAGMIGSIESEALAHQASEAADSDEGGFTGGFPVELVLADVAAAMTAADDAELILPQLEAAMHLLELMVVIGGADMNPGALSLLYREEAVSAAHGLDWSRAEGLYDDSGHDHEHVHEDEYGSDAYGFDDDFGYAGGFGGYSEN